MGLDGEVLALEGGDGDGWDVVCLAVFDGGGELGAGLYEGFAGEIVDFSGLYQAVFEVGHDEVSAWT